MFHLTYTRQELRRRLGRTLLTALGLAVGVGLVVGILSVSAGLDDAQQQVLAPLGSVGTDILVTRVAGATSTTDSSTTPTTAPANGATNGNRNGAGGNGGGGFFGGRNSGLNRQDADALLAENQNVVTDLAKLGTPGSQFTRDFYLSATLVSFPDSAISDIQKLPGVKQVSGGLVQLATHQTGTVPQIVASLQTGGQTFTQTVRPAPMTDAERQAFGDCLQSKGVTIGGGGGGATDGGGGTPPADGGGAADGGGGAGGGGGGGGGRGFRNNPAFQDCLPQRFKEFQAQFTTPLQTIQQVVDPPSTDIKSESYTAAGVDPANVDQGLVTEEQLTDGRWLGTGDAAKDEVLLNVAYANTKKMKVGDTLPINGTDYKVVGLVRPTLTGSTADVYFPLATLQGLAGKQNRVTSVLVKATDADHVAAVAAAIKKQLPGAEVVTTAALADQVTGSLADAKSLASRLGGVLAGIVLLAAFAIAALLTLSSVAKRTRELGTLRAIGWSKGRVVRQVLGETLAIGLLGGLLGVAFGVLVAASVPHIAPTLSATSAGIPGLAGSSLSGFFGQATSAASTRTITMRAPLSAATLAIGVAFALFGGLLAGLLGGWRAARLSPSVALRDLG